MATTFGESIYTTDEAARKLKLDTASVCRYCRLGRIKARRIGRSWIITKTALEEFKAEPREVGNPNFKKQ